MSYTLYKKNLMRYGRRLKEYASDFPDYASEFLEERSSFTSTMTMTAYAYDLRVFFSYLLLFDEELASMDLADIPVRVFDEMRPEKISEFLDVLRSQGHSPTSIDRKVSSISEFYNYLIANGYCDTNPVLYLKRSRDRSDKAFSFSRFQTEQLLAGILRNDLYLVGSGDDTEVKKIDRKTWLKRDRYVSRNYAIVVLILGTGIGLSELAGLDLNDLELSGNRLKVLRKNHVEEWIYFGPEVHDALSLYLHGEPFPADIREKYPYWEDLADFCRMHMCRTDLRKKVAAAFGTDDPVFLNDAERVASCMRHAGREGLKPAHGETALFLSNRGKRLSERMVQVMIKDLVRTYVSGAAQVKAASPQNLRATFTKRVKEQTGDPNRTVDDKIPLSEVRRTKQKSRDQLELWLRDWDDD